jgi:hypothetical protein
MNCVLYVLSALALLVSLASAQAPGSPARWEVFANCAAAYRANWQNRLSDPGRAPSMAAMIRDESEHYQTTAVGYFEKDRKTARSEANRTVSAHVLANVDRFIAMDKAGTLEAYIDACPQIEDPN